MADVATTASLSRASVQAAQVLVAPHVHRTPVVTSRTLSRLASTPQTDEALGDGGSGRVAARPTLRLWFKCENLQRVGAFKARGAFHAVGKLMREPGWVEGGGKERGVVTHSSGNHAQALAIAARENGIRAHIVMPVDSAPQKMAATRGYGARVVVSGRTSVEREAVAARVMAETGARLVPPYDDADIILGQGTLGLELQEQVAEMMSCGGGGGGATESKRRKKAGLDAIIAPCGGGGMLSGVALSCEGTGIRVFGAEPWLDGADDARRGVEAGERVATVASRTVADGLRTPLGDIPWELLMTTRSSSRSRSRSRRLGSADDGLPLVAGFYSVSEAEIVAAMRLVLERLKMVVEPSACVPLAVALFDERFRRMVEEEAGDEGWDLGVVLSGGNVGVEALGKIFGMGQEG